MAKKVARQVRGKFTDEKYLGPEPDFSSTVHIAEYDLVRAYSWYNYFYSNDEAKAWCLEYLESIGTSKTILKNVTNLPFSNYRTHGWVCRLALRNQPIAQEIVDKIVTDLKTSPSLEKEVKNVPTVRIRNPVGDIVADVDDWIDSFLKTGEKIDISAYIRNRNIKPNHAKDVATHFKRLYSELVDALANKDEDLKISYAFLRKAKVLKPYTEFVKSIVTEFEGRVEVVQSSRQPRKPRKKKEKPASVIVANLRYKEKDDEYNLKSINPVEILGASQLWVFNTKYRTITVYHSLGSDGIRVKGSTLLGWDEKTSVTKKLRKPLEQLKPVIEGGKLVLRKYMDSITTTAGIPNGRLNGECLLLRSLR